MCAPCPVATSPGGTRRGRGGAHGRPAALPRTPRAASDGTAGLLASGSSYSRAFPRGQPPFGGSTARSGTSPVSYPVTVAGATPESHRLPFRGRRTSSQRRRRHRTVGLSKKALGRRRRCRCFVNGRSVRSVRSVAIGGSRARTDRATADWLRPAPEPAAESASAAPAPAPREARTRQPAWRGSRRSARC